MTERERKKHGLLFIANKVDELRCSNCGGQVVEFSVPNHIWNMVVRSNGKEHDNEYLCIWCFVDLAIVFIEERVV